MSRKYKLINNMDYEPWKIGNIFDENYIIYNTHCTVKELVQKYPEDWQLIEDNNMEELKISKERILEAAAKCSTAKATLQVLFPEVFEDEKYFDFRNCKINWVIPSDHHFIPSNINIRSTGDFAYKGFYLSSSVNWEIKKDNCGESCLIPTKKY